MCINHDLLSDHLNFVQFNMTKLQKSVNLGQQVVAGSAYLVSLCLSPLGGVLSMAEGGMGLLQVK